MTPEEQFLLEMRDAAKAAGHIFPEYAACEVAIESGWGKSQLASSANNLFGQKAPAKLPQGQMTITLPTQEVQNGMSVRVTADWLRFPSAQACLEARMALLRRLPIYYYALHANDGEEFVIQVSGRWQALPGTPLPGPDVFEFSTGWMQFMQPRWSTNPGRASAVLETYKAHASIFTETEPTATQPDAATTETV